MFEREEEGRGVQSEDEDEDFLVGFNFDFFLPSC